MSEQSERDLSDETRDILDFLVWQLDQSFEFKPEHSLLRNLSTVTAAMLDQPPSSGGRTLRDLIAHCASVKRMHANHAFGDRRMTWWTTWDGPDQMEKSPLAELIAWLRRAHAEAQAAVRALEEDAELLMERRTHWGELRQTRFIIDAIVIHDVYHAGEINHLRGLLQDADQFPHGGRT